MKKLKVGLKRIFGRKSTERKNAESAHTAPAKSSENKATSLEKTIKETTALLPEEEWQRSIERVEDTPFNLIIEEKSDEKQIQIVLGNQIASPKKFKNTDEAKKYIYSKPYQLMYVMIGVLCEKFNNEFKNN